MAEFGAKHPAFKPKNAASGMIIGKLVLANLTVNLASGELYADDSLAEQLSEFSSGNIAMETDNMSDSVASAIYGASVSNGVVTYKKNDTPPEGVLGYYKVLMVNGTKKYRAYVYPRAKAALGNDNAQTRGSSITFQTAQTSFTIFDDESGAWRKTKDFNTETEAKAFIDSECSVSGSGSANLSTLTIGELALSPNFSSSVTEYTANTSATSDKITAGAEDSNATVVIKNGSTTVTNGGNASLSDGENTITVTVTNGTEERVYTVIVTKS
jgi:phi13 family phage major tail protein